MSRSHHQDRNRQGHLWRFWWGWGKSVAGHNWVRLEYRRQLYPGTTVFAEHTRFWEVQWR